MRQIYMQFWKLRQSELEPYALQYSPLKAKYGDLGDPVSLPSCRPIMYLERHLASHFICPLSSLFSTIKAYVHVKETTSAHS